MQLKINFSVCLFCNDKRRLIADKTVIKHLSKIVKTGAKIRGNCTFRFEKLYISFSRLYVVDVKEGRQTECQKVSFSP